jgi:hypothetical protein
MLWRIFILKLEIKNKRQNRTKNKPSAKNKNKSKRQMKTLKQPVDKNKIELIRLMCLHHLHLLFFHFNLLFVALYLVAASLALEIFFCACMALTPMIPPPHLTVELSL